MASAAEKDLKHLLDSVQLWADMLAEAKDSPVMLKTHAEYLIEAMHEADEMYRPTVFGVG